MHESLGYVTDYALWLILIGVAVATIHSRSLLRSLVYLAIFSLICACLYLLMQAPDVAITEAAIGAAISTIFFLIAIRSIGEDESTPRNFQYLGAIIVVGLALTLAFVASDLPVYGSAVSPAQQGSSAEYLNKSYGATAIPNYVTAILASYRGFDTLGEVYVILAATLCVMLILPIKREGKDGA